ncbi:MULTISPECIES: DinB family protein [Streptacidiphilus]|uniref:DinB family protein n=1 Tax=Streptacidiphilus cavernicola TaxID=3342716 RepID=A0ABV6UKA0_9ACTN|nr:DinB family protein [Streptacidiphilus jeojiense]
MVEFSNEDLTGSRFQRVDLTGSRFQLARLGGVKFRGCAFGSTRFRIVEMDDVTMRGVELNNVEISGDIGNLRINGVEVGPLVEAELDRRYPERPRMRPTDAAGFREAWDILEHLWGGTVERAGRLDPTLLDESVDGEWSFLQTLRHLVLVTDGWIRRTVLDLPSPWHPLGLPWDDPDETRSLPEGLPRDREARPTLDTVLQVRRDRMATVRSVIAGITDQSLDSETEPARTPGWPEPRSRRLRTVLLHLFHEEWEHRLYAERDLDALEAHRS